MLLNNYCCKTKQGFTLTELLITLTIVVILLALAIPNFQALVVDNRLSAQTNNLVSGLALARSEAIKRGTEITLCKNTDCSTTNGYEQGWVVFEDTNGDGDPDAGEPIRFFEAMPGNISATGENGLANSVSFSAMGGAVQAGDICIKSDDYETYTRHIKVALGGSLSSLDNEDCPCPNDVDDIVETCP